MSPRAKEEKKGGARCRRKKKGGGAGALLKGETGWSRGKEKEPDSVEAPKKMVMFRKGRGRKGGSLSIRAEKRVGRLKKKKTELVCARTRREEGFF